MTQVVKCELCYRMNMFIDRETIRITKHGVWLSDGEEITHQETLKAYKTHIGRDDEGYFIEIGRDFKRIEVEDTAFFVEQIFMAPQSAEIRLSDGSLEKLKLSTLEHSPERLICQVKEGKFPARFLVQPYHELLLHCEETRDGYRLKIGDESVDLN